MFLRRRRFTREFQKTPVPRKKIRQLPNIARFAPTSRRSHLL
ncbi:MAG: nitroreductase family protein [Desulfosporosinus sp.]|nr:nitroreductase family protein [Desulfosporosinus sp.]